MPKQQCIKNSTSAKIFPGEYGDIGFGSVAMKFAQRDPSQEKFLSFKIWLQTPFSERILENNVRKTKINIIAVNDDENNVDAFSGKKNHTNLEDEYSVIWPDTNSDSASTLSEQAWHIQPTSYKSG